jgi:hypothetical protein
VLSLLIRTETVTRIKQYLSQNSSIAPLVIFRIAFGALMFLSISRFIAKGWVYSMYILPKMYFPYYGFEWVKPFSAIGMYIVFGVLILASLGILLGAFYRFSAVLFFILFTYVELIDKTNYLNHYYFVSLVSFIMIFVPAADNFSIDNLRLKRSETQIVPRVYVFIIQLQMFIVYFFAGVAKLNYEWLIEAQPLKLWLPAFSHYPIIGQFMEADWLAYLFAWFGCIYDLSIGFFLFNKRTVNIAYAFVVLFHLATALFFNIGMFPYIMMTITIIFFREEFHLKLLRIFMRITRYTRILSAPAKNFPGKVFISVFLTVFAIQLMLPFRYICYPGKLFWTEQGYRFSWRVMLIEKAGTAFFFVKDAKSGREVEIDNKEHLTYMQEKMMATQPDMMIDYAKYLKEEFRKKGFTDPTVRAQSYVTLNGCGTREFIDPTIDLSSLSNSFLETKYWVRSY